MKTKRNLSGITCRVHREGKKVNVCFEDLDHAEQLKLLATKDQSWILSLAISLADTLNEIGEEFNIEKQ
jgi:hypothetical protein